MISSLLKKLMKIHFSFLRFIIFFPIIIIFIIIIIILYPFFQIRIGRFRSDKIGHLSLEYEIHLIEKKLNTNHNKNKFNIWYRDKVICNKFLFNIRRKQFFIVPDFFFKEIYYLLKFLKLNDKFCCDRNNSDADINCVLDNSKTTFNVPKDIINQNLNKLKLLGLKNNQKIITIHLRDSAFRGLSKMTDYKNIYNFKDYYKSINYLIKKGFFVIRTGHAVNYKFNIKNNNFLDYPFSNIKSDIMDIVIAKQSFFCISSGSGFDGIVRTFRNPVLFINFVPLGYFPSYSIKNMCIFKHYKNKISNKFLSFKEILNKNIIYCNDGRTLSQKNILLVENSEIEIKNAIIDMLNLLNGKFNNKEYMPFQRKIEKFFTKEVEYENKYTTHTNIKSKIAPSYLKKNKYII